MGDLQGTSKGMTVESSPSAAARRRRGGRRSARSGAARNRFWGALWRLVQFLVLVALLGYAGYQSWYIFFRASYFKLAGIRVCNLRAVDRDEIVRVSGIELGTPIFGIDREKVAAKVCLHPRVRSCFVEREGVNEIVLRIVERDPVAKIVYNDDLYEIDEEGILLGRISTQAPLPLVTGTEVRTRPDGTLGLDPGACELLRRWLRVLESTGVRNPAEFDFSARPKIRIRWRGVMLFVEGEENFERHEPYLEDILEDARRNELRLEYLDLRFGDIVGKYRRNPMGGGPRVR